MKDVSLATGSQCLLQEKQLKREGKLSPSNSVLSNQMRSQRVGKRPCPPAFQHGRPMGSLIEFVGDKQSVQGVKQLGYHQLQIQTLQSAQETQTDSRVVQVLHISVIVSCFPLCVPVASDVFSMSLLDYHLYWTTIREGFKPASLKSFLLTPTLSTPEDHHSGSL
ncbi:unnamed protein product [Nezara viridula]|uniref:Uncharacterized protein n=1 Tax=Nezara viridula TaxID=85310 RepID=A0A9P0E843_NEZVI|nr:unnamed protein product [Nezara viridula]